MKNQYDENDIQKALTMAEDFIQKSPWKDTYGNQIRLLREDFQKPCVLTVAIAGRVKAGKSTLLNALLGEDLAKVGILPTTATINSFYYFPGELDHPDRPIQCLWREPEDGSDSCWMSPDELAALQTNDSEMLKKTLNIRELRYYLHNENLREMNLVDTPGTRTLISEHTDQTDDFFQIYDSEEKRRLANQRLSQNNVDTSKYASRADAVLFVSGNVPLDSMRDFLRAFQQGTSSRNAIGVISQIDSSEDTLRNRHTLAANMARNLRKEINTAIPISAALARALQLGSQSGLLKEIFEAVRRFKPDDLDYCLSYFDEWCDSEAPEYPVPPSERKRLLGAMSFEVFALIAREMAGSNYETALQNLWEISGFVALQKLLKEHFLNRKRVLRYFKTVTALIRIFNEIRLTSLNDYRNQALREARELLEMKRYIMLCPANDSELRCRIFDRLERTLHPDDSNQWEQRICDLLLHFEKIGQSLQGHNVRFEGLLRLEECRGTLSPAEQEELKALFGCHSEDSRRLPTSEPELLACKQKWMLRERMMIGDTPEKQVAHFAVAVYDLEIRNFRGASSRGNK